LRKEYAYPSRLPGSHALIAGFAARHDLGPDGWNAANCCCTGFGCERGTESIPAPENLHLDENTLMLGADFETEMQIHVGETIRDRSRSRRRRRRWSRAQRKCGLIDNVGPA
jgi:hypothetical protein